MKVSKSNIISWLKFLIGWPLALISIGFVIEYIANQSSGITFKLSEINYYYLLISIFLFYIYYVLRSYLWKNLIETENKSINFIENTYRFAISELKRFTPGNIWSFLSRANLFTELGFNKRIVGLSMIADIQLVVLGCSIVSLLAIPILINSSEQLQGKLISLIPFSIILIIIYFLVIGFIYKNKFDKSSSIFKNLVLPGFDNNKKIKVLFISAFTYFIYGAGNFFVLISLTNTSISNFFILSAFFTFALLVGYLTFITPMGLGVREIIVTLGLSQFLSAADAGAVSIFSRIILIISELTFLAFIFLWKKQKLNH